jgi:hypothetical protein
MRDEQKECISLLMQQKQAFALLSQSNTFYPFDPLNPLTSF